MLFTYDYCWIEGIYQEDEKSDEDPIPPPTKDNTTANVGQQGKIAGGDEVVVETPIPIPMKKKESFIDNILHSLNVFNDTICCDNEANEANEANETSSQIGNTDINTESTGSSGSCYAQIIIPLSGNSPITPSTITSHAFTNHSGGSRDSSISTIKECTKSSFPLLQNNSNKSVNKGCSPSSATLPSLDISSIEKTSSSSQITNNSFAEADSSSPKEKIDKYSTIKYPKSKAMNTTESNIEDNAPMAFIHIDSPMRDMCLSPTRMRKGSDYRMRPPLSPTHRRDEPIQVEDESSLEAPPQLRRCVLANDFLFVPEKYKGSEDESLYFESVEVKISSEKGTTMSFQEQEVTVVVDESRMDDFNEDMIGIETFDEFKLNHFSPLKDLDVSSLTDDQYLRDNEDESLIGDDLVIDDDMMCFGSNEEIPVL